MAALVGSFAAVSACTTEDEAPPVTLVALINASAPATDVSGTQFCAGVLIAADAVLTAGHCMTDRAASTIDAIISADNLCRTDAIDGVRVHVAAVWIDDEADGAVLTLTTPVDVEPATTAPTAPGEGDHVVAWGWGKDTVGGTAPCRAEPKSVTVVPMSRCVFTPTWGASRAACGEAAAARNTCEGDSGGPVLDQAGALVAVTASGLGCRTADPGTYTLAGPVVAGSGAAGRP